MFLSKKELRKVRLMTALYLFIGAFCLTLYFLLSCYQVNSHLLLILGVLCFVFSVLVYKSGKYVEGKSKLLDSGNRLVSQQLQPAEFIRLYEQKRDDPDNVISKPDFDILSVLVMAYDALGDTDKSLETTDQMLLIATERKKPRAKLVKASILYSIGKVDEAELLYKEAQSGQMDMITKATLDVVLKTNRAMALGDYLTAEMFNKQLLDRTFPKTTPLSILYAHFTLAKIYIETERAADAKVHLSFCIENGGQTALKRDAAKMLNNLS